MLTVSGASQGAQWLRIHLGGHIESDTTEWAHTHTACLMFWVLYFILSSQQLCEVDIVPHLTGEETDSEKLSN